MTWIFYILRRSGRRDSFILNALALGQVPEAPDGLVKLLLTQQVKGDLFSVLLAVS